MNMLMPARCLILTLAIGCINGLALGADVVERRGTAATLEGTIERMDAAGVTIRTTAVHFVPWHQVRNVKPRKPDLAVPLDEYLKDAESLWRARTRLERGDAALAEPLFERVFARLKGQTHETALVAAEGLLRCRLARGANDTAVIAALEAARLRRAKLNTDAFSRLPSVLDGGTSLCPALPPAWAVSQGLVKLERELAAYDAQHDAVIAALASAYHHAVKRHLGMVEQDSASPAANHPGAMLIHSLVGLETGDQRARQSSRETLERMLPTLPAWAQAWAHFGIGMSMLADPNSGALSDGLVRLAHLPAMYGQSQPYLAGLAISSMADALDRSGEGAAAAALREELAREFPGHPVIAAGTTRSKASTTS